jgi:hypothetical protein
MQRKAYKINYLPPTVESILWVKAGEKRNCFQLISSCFMFFYLFLTA